MHAYGVEVSSCDGIWWEALDTIGRTRRNPSRGLSVVSRGVHKGQRKRQGKLPGRTVIPPPSDFTRPPVSGGGAELFAGGGLET